MKEKLILFETAVLSKEKGFNWDCTSYYENSNYLVNQHEKDNWNQFKLQAAPTQALLQKWLREKHNIHIQNHFLNNKYAVKVKFNVNESTNIYNMETYEEALEAGLLQALKLITFNQAND